jgi:hypothetical protein
MSDTVVIGIGCAALGAALGGIIAYYIAKVRDFNLRGLTSVVGILGGAGVIGIFKLMGGDPSVAFWFYPVGLLVGLGFVAAYFTNPTGT